MFLQSIRFKIVLWYMLILGSTLLVFGVLFYHQYKIEITSDFDDLLRSKAKVIDTSIDTYWETEKLEASQQFNQAVSAKAFAKRGNSNFVKIAERWVEEQDTDPILLNMLVRIYDANGKNIAFSKALKPLAKLSVDVFNSAKAGQASIKEKNVELNNGKNVALRVLTVGVFENKELAYVIQVASPMDSIGNALSNLSWLLFLFLPATVILTSIAGAFLAKQTLKPVNQITTTINQITVENLKLRLNIPSTKDEIEALARTFNDMIARLDEAFTSQRRFMEDISHELKTPLAILKGELEVTLKKIRSAEEYTTILHSSLEEINHLVRIVEQLLLLARFDTKTIAMEALPLDLNTLIKDAVDDVRVLADQKQISLHFDDAHMDLVQADKNQIKRLLLNILDNAIKYTPKGGRVSISLSQQKNKVAIDIADNGIGIPEGELQHIFDRFYRVDKSRSSGFGLGLSIAQSIAQAHGGGIHARPNAPQGTIFTVSLPSIKL